MIDLCTMQLFACDMSKGLSNIHRSFTVARFVHYN